MSFIPMPNEFQINKLIFFRESCYRESSKTAQWNLYINYISDIELNSNKDLSDFNNSEIDKCNEKVKELKKDTVRMLNSFISRYLDWSSKYFDKAINLFKLDIAKNIDTSWYISKSKFYGICEKLINKVDVQYILPLLLMRYGITGKQMIYLRTLKWKDINFEMNKVFLYDKNDLILCIPVDFYFLKWIDIIKTIEIEKYKNKNINDYYVLQDEEYKNKIINYNTINTRIYISCKSIQIKRISPYSLDTSAKIDYLFKLSQQGFIITKVVIQEKLFQEWYKKDTNSSGAIYKLKNLYDCWLNNKSLSDEVPISNIDYNKIYLKTKSITKNSIKNKTNISKPVICITTNKKFKSSVEASKYYKIDKVGIRKCCKGKQKSAGSIILDDGTKFKLKWKYLNN